MTARITAPVPPARQRIAATTAATSLGFFMVQLDGSITNVGLARIGGSLGAGMRGLQWVVDVYFMTFAVLLLSAGLLGDRLGAKRAYLLGFKIFSAASLACAASPSLVALVVARAWQGCGAALLVPCSLALLNAACAESGVPRARAVGIWTAAGSLALAIGPAVGGLMISALGWRSVFLVNLPVGILGVWMTAGLADSPRTTTAPGDFDVAGQLLAILALVGLVGAIIQVGENGWDSPLVAGGLIIAIVSTSAFIETERRSRCPMLPLTLFRNRVFSGTASIGFVINLASFGLTFALGLYFQHVLGWSVVDTGLAFLPWAIVVTVANVIGGSIAARRGFRPPLIGGLLTAAVGFALLSRVDASTSYIEMMPAQLIIRIGTGLSIPAITAALLSAVTRDQAGVSSGALNALRQTGGAVGVALFGSLMTDDPAYGFQVALGVSAVLLCVASAVAAFTTHNREQRGAARAMPHRDRDPAGLYGKERLFVTGAAVDSVRHPLVPRHSDAGRVFFPWVQPTRQEGYCGMDIDFSGDLLAIRDKVLSKIGEEYHRVLPTVDEILSYGEKGYYISRPIFTDGEIDRAYEGSEEHYAGHRDWHLPTELVRAYLDWKPGMTDGLRINDYIALQNRKIGALMRHPAVGAIAALLVGTDEIRLFNSSMIYKAPRATRDDEMVGWHTDKAYWGTCTSSRMITAGIPLHDCPLDKGPLVVIEGSHLWPNDGPIADLRRERNFKFVNLADIEARIVSSKHEIRKVPLITTKGQVTFHHAQVFHGSGLNTSKTSRRLVVLHLQDKENQYREYYDSTGSLYIYNNDLMCRRDAMGRPDYSDPAICPVLFPSQSG